MSAGDVIATAIWMDRRLKVRLTPEAFSDAIIETLTDAGYRILGPDELDPVIDLLKRLTAIREWNHDDDRSARLDYDRAAEDAAALVCTLTPETPQPEDKEAHHAD